MIDDFNPQPVRRHVAVEPPSPKIRYDESPASVDPDVDDTDDEPTEQISEAQAPEPSEDILEIQQADDGIDHQPDTPSPKPRRQWKWRPTKKQLAISIPVVLVILTTGSAAAWVQTHKGVKATPSTTKTIVKKKPAPIVITSTLTGLPVADASVNQRPVTGVMVENSPDARPQSGLDQAGVVFEAIAEGGITRFLTLFQDSQPDYIGPVRSARPYYVQWCMGFDCSLAHVGGSPEALDDIKSWGVKDLDQFANGGSYQRINSRYAPHNVYTNITQLNQLESSKGFGASSFTGFPRKKDSPYQSPNVGTKVTGKINEAATHDSRTPAATIDMNISGYYYNTHYDYDTTTNSYKRSEGGAPHLSQHKDGSKVQIQPKVVVVMVMQYGLEADDHHSQYNVIGTGDAFVFQDGTATKGTWVKNDANSQITFADQDGKPIPFNAGQTWLTALSGADQVTFK